MDAAAVAVFLVSAFVGSYFQAVTGFAMGLIIVAVAGATGVIPLPVVTAVVSLLAMVNVAVSLRGRLHAVHRGLFVGMALGQVVVIWFGVWLLGYLDGNDRSMLQLLLGTFVTLGALSLLLRPAPWRAVSSPAAGFAAGAAGGLVGGLFAASGPVLGWFTYRQPLSLDAVRATLLCCFAVTTGTRTLFVAASGGLTPEVWWAAAVGLPVVVGASALGRRYPPPLSDDGTKRLAVAALLAAGVWILLSAL